MEATRLAPDDDRAWCALSDFHVRTCLHELGPFDVSFVDRQGDLGKLAVHAREWLSRTKASPEWIAAAPSDCVRRAGVAADRAVGVAQPSLEAYMTRWLLRTSLEPMLMAMLGIVADPAEGTPASRSTLESLEDLGAPR